MFPFAPANSGTPLNLGLPSFTASPPSTATSDKTAAAKKETPKVDAHGDLITPNLGTLLLGQVPALPGDPTLPLAQAPAVDAKNLPGPPSLFFGQDPQAAIGAMEKNQSVAGHLPYAKYYYKNNLPGYLDSIKKSWFTGDSDGVKATRKNYVAWETYFGVALLLYRQSTNPDEKGKFLKSALDAQAGYVESLKAQSQEGNIRGTADGTRRLTAITGLLLKDLNADGQAHPEEKEILGKLRDAYKNLDGSIDAKSPEFAYIQEFARAQVIKFDLMLNPPDPEKPAEIRKKISELGSHLNKAKNLQKDDSPLKEDFAPMIDADLKLVPSLPNDRDLARVFISRYSATFLMTIASEIDLKDGDSRPAVEKRYQDLSAQLDQKLSANPELAVGDALSQIDSPDAKHLLSLIKDHQVLQQVRDADGTAFTLVSGSASVGEIVGSWEKNLIGILQGHMNFSSKVFEHGELHLGSYQEILSQFVKKMGVGPSPVAESLQSLLGTTPDKEQDISNQATQILRDMDSTSFKIGNGFAEFLSVKTLLFVGGATLLNRAVGGLLLRGAGASGNLGKGMFQLVEGGEMTSLGHFTVGAGAGTLLTLGPSFQQYVKDKIADRPDAGANFWRNFAVGSVINVAVLGFSAVGSAAVKRRFSNPTLLQEAEQAPLSKFDLFKAKALPFATSVFIGTGSMLGANAFARGVFHNWKSSTKDSDKVPYFTVDETTETLLTMISLNLAETGVNKALASQGSTKIGEKLLNFQLGEFRAKQIEQLSIEIADAKFASLPAPDPAETVTAEQIRNMQKPVYQRAVFNRLALYALEGMPLKDIADPRLKAHVGKTIEIPVIDLPKGKPPSSSNPPPANGAPAAGEGKVPSNPPGPDAFQLGKVELPPDTTVVALESNGGTKNRPLLSKLLGLDKVPEDMKGLRIVRVGDQFKLAIPDPKSKKVTITREYGTDAGLEVQASNETATLGEVGEFVKIRVGDEKQPTYTLFLDDEAGNGQKMPQVRVKYKDRETVVRFRSTEGGINFGRLWNPKTGPKLFTKADQYISRHHFSLSTTVHEGQPFYVLIAEGNNPLLVDRQITLKKGQAIFLQPGLIHGIETFKEFEPNPVGVEPIPVYDDPILLDLSKIETRFKAWDTTAGMPEPTGTVDAAEQKGPFLLPPKEAIQPPPPKPFKSPGVPPPPTAAKPSGSNPPGLPDGVYRASSGMVFQFEKRSSDPDKTEFNAQIAKVIRVKPQADGTVVVRVKKGFKTTASEELEFKLPREKVAELGIKAGGELILKHWLPPITPPPVKTPSTPPQAAAPVTPPAASDGAPEAVEGEALPVQPLPPIPEKRADDGDPTLKMERTGDKAKGEETDEDATVLDADDPDVMIGGSESKAPPPPPPADPATAAKDPQEYQIPEGVPEVPEDTLVTMGISTQAIGALQRIKESLEIDENFSPGDHYVTIRLREQNGNLKMQGFEYSETAPTCGKNQLVLEIHVDEAGKKQFYIVEEELSALSQQIRDLVRVSFPPP
ncbi:MAG: hypothetical protein U1F57_02040 [bacterium]